MRTVLILAIAICVCNSLPAQLTQTQKLLPVLAPSSPEAAAFSRYGNYQVNLFTGIPDISIPLYEIKVGELNVPISLNYHPSGIKVSDIPSRVGLGWDLQAGGSITRKIMGKPDELAGNYLSATSTSWNRVRTGAEINQGTQDGLDYLGNIDKGFYDVEPDIFSYSFPGHGGKFLFNQKDNFKPVLIPYAPIDVNGITSPSNLALKITDESGIQYRFDSTEWSISGGGISTSCTSAWLLSDMISANQQDAIHFRYASRANNGGPTDSYFSDFMVLNDNCTGTYAGNCTTTGNYTSDFGSVLTSWKQLTQIDFRNGKVVFEAAPESREDFSSMYQLQNRINAIKVYSLNQSDNSYTLIKTIQFFHSYFINGGYTNTKRLKLDSVQIKMSNGNVAQTYKFDYNTSIPLPAKDSRMKDYWGYYNNKTSLDPNGNPTLIPRMQVQYNNPPYAPSMIWIGGHILNAREPDPYYMQAYILQKITYPTGGNTQFEYETNQYLDDSGNPKYAGGLRIKTIRSYSDVNAIPIVKSYKYGSNESGYGRSNFLLEDHFFVRVLNQQTAAQFGPNGACMGPNTRTTRTYFSNPTNDLESYDGSPVVYPVVSEYLGDGSSFSGKTIYKFSDRTDGKTSIIGLGKPLLTSYHFVRGLLTNRLDYKRNSDNSYSLVSENRKRYQYFPYQNTTGGIGLVVNKFYDFDGYNSVNITTLCESMMNVIYYDYNNYEIITGDNKLVSDTLITYHQTDPSKSNSVISSYAYDDVVHLQLTQSQTTNSKNQLISSSFTYPHNYNSYPYTAMTYNHIFNKVINNAKSNSSSGFLNGQKNNYSVFSGINFLPSSIDLQIANNNVETRAYFTQYDSYGNVLERHKAGDLNEVYLWSYNSMYPVAKIVGSSLAAVTSIVSQSQIDAAVSSDANMRSVLNNLRTGLPSAFVTTYTYAPLVGLTSQTDPAGKTTYYEYDGLGRLSILRDQDLNILKKYEYNYATSYSASAPPPPSSTPCTITMNYGYSSPTRNVNNNGTTVSGYIVFYPTNSTMYGGTMYQIATIGSGCTPSSTRTFTTYSAGRNWTITVYAGGMIYVQMAYGSAPLSTYTTVSLNISYNL